MKNSKVMKNPSVTAPSKVKADASLPDPRGYLQSVDESLRQGHTKIPGDLDHFDKERNQTRMGRKHRLPNEPQEDLG